MSKRDYYEVLVIERSATPDEIKKAYRKLALEFHPDRNPDKPDAEEKFKEAAEAYQVLSDPEKRAMYDQYGHAGFQSRGDGGVGFGDIGDIFSHFRDIFGGDMFGDVFGGGRGRSANGPQRGADLRIATAISLKDAVFGIKRDVELMHPSPCKTCDGSGAAAGSPPVTCEACRGRGQVTRSRGAFMFATTCPTCRGQGSVIKTPCADCRGVGETDLKRTLNVTIPAGIEDGQTLRVPGQGQAGRKSGPTGHLYIDVHVEPNEAFTREGADLIHELKIGFAEAALGADVEMPTLDGEKVRVKIPAGAQPGDTVVVSGHGVPMRGGRGDLVGVLQIAVPKKLSSKAKKLLQELQNELKD